MFHRTFAGVLLATVLGCTAAIAAGPTPGAGSSGGSAGASAGCSGNVLLSDDFTEVDPAWSLNGTNSTIVGGKMRIKPEPGYGQGAFYQGAVFGNADMCVDITSPELRDSNISAGIVFHYTDWDNYIAVLINPSGRLGVARVDNKQVLFPVAWRDVPNLKKGANVVNSIRATWSGTSLAIYVNGQHIVTGKLIGVTGKSTIGFVGYSEKDASNVWLFDNFVVSEPPK